MSNLRKLICPSRVSRRKSKQYYIPIMGKTRMHDLAERVVIEAFFPYIIDHREDWITRYTYLLMDSGREREVIENVTYRQYYRWANTVFDSRYGIRRIENMAPEYAYCHAELFIGSPVYDSKTKYVYHRENFSVVWVNIPNSEIVGKPGFLDDFFYNYLGRLICRVFWHRRTKGNVKLFTEHVKDCIDFKDIFSWDNLKSFTIPCNPIDPCNDIVRLVITENV